MRFMLMMNAPWAPTGYGTQGKLLAKALQKAGHEVAIFANYGLAGGNLQMGGFRVYSPYHDAWGKDVLPAHMDHFKADYLITLMDVWVTDWLGDANKKGDIRWIPWFPIDHEPIPERVLEKIDGCHTALAYSAFGYHELYKANVKNRHYIPHAIDTKVFYPGDKAAARELIDIPQDAFVIGMVATNKGYPDRKAFTEQMIAFRDFQRNHSEALMFMHTNTDQSMGGLDIRKLAAALEIPPDAIRFPSPYSYINGWPEERIVELYRSFDVLTNCAMGEGFGLPILEAQACGVPVVVNDWTSMTELCFAGKLINRKNLYPVWTLLDSWAVRPDPAAILDAYEDLYQGLHNPEYAQILANDAVKGAAEYEIDVIFEDYWQPFIERLQDDLDAEHINQQQDNAQE